MSDTCEGRRVEMQGSSAHVAHARAIDGLRLREMTKRMETVSKAKRYPENVAHGLLLPAAAACCLLLLPAAYCLLPAAAAAEDEVEG